MTADELQELRDDMGALEERLGALEGEGTAEGASDSTAGSDQSEELFGDAESLVGQEVTVSAEVSELVTTTDTGSAFRIAGESGEPIAVISAGSTMQLDQSDVVQVSGTVMMVQRTTFEQDFGVAADELFEDADGFFETEEGQPAISATQVEVLQEQAEG